MTRHGKNGGRGMLNIDLKRKQDGKFNPDKPWEDDKLGREKEAKNLTTLIGSTSDPIVMSVEAGYGEGKSFFIERWEQQLKNDGHPTVYFNAWETDFTGDPLMAFLAVIEKQLLERPEISNRENILGALKKLGKTSFFNIVKKTTVDIVDLEKMDEQLETWTSKCFKDFHEHHNAIKEIKKVLGNEQLILEGATYKKPIVIFVDELDRCRPDYAIELLEIIKHLFYVEGFVFVLAVNQKTLVAAINSVYGVDGKEYLGKFIDWEYRLQEPKIEPYVEMLYEEFGFGKDGILTEGDGILNEKQYFMEGMLLCVDVFELSLRDVHQYFTKLNIIMRGMGDQPKFPMLLVFLTVLRDREKEEYKGMYKEYCLKTGMDATLRAKINRVLQNVSNVGLSKDLINNFQYGLKDFSKLSRNKSPIYPGQQRQKYLSEVEKLLGEISDADKDRIFDIHHLLCKKGYERIGEYLYDHIELINDFVVEEVNA